MHPPTEILALVHDVAGLGRQRTAGLQVEPNEVEAPLPLHRSSCSRGSSDSAPATDSTGSPSARR
ncbi:hypothetical protein [Streptomyces achromogenes]|uniref:hypothetical protein n=1 Tax=Streptomyces achromogenes TaxID=67255 RepID=UPI00386F58C5